MAFFKQKQKTNTQNEAAQLPHNELLNSVPQTGKPGQSNQAGYYTFSAHDIGSLPMPKRKLQKLFVTILSVTLASLIGIFTLQNGYAMMLNSRIAAQQKAGEYSGAQQNITTLQDYVLIPPIAGKTNQYAKQNSTWLSYVSLQKQADDLARGGKYADALDVLGRIGKEFPTYAKVQSAVDVITKQKADAEKAAAEQQAKDKTSTQAVQTPTIKKTTPLTTSTTGGKRFASTAAVTSLAAATNLDQAQAALKNFFDQYGMAVSITSINQGSYIPVYVTFEQLAPGDLNFVKSYGALLIDEWAKYPTDWVTKSGVLGVNLVKTIKVQGQQRGSTYDAYSTHTMWYDPIYNSSGGELYGREVIHHEYDHLIETNYWGTYARSDPTWLSYNPAGFSYGAGGSSAYNNPNYSYDLHPLAGFVSSYGTYAIEEDKAELYAFLMTGQYYKQVKEWIKIDKNLADKVANYKAFIESKSPSMSGSYFDSINP